MNIKDKIFLVGFLDIITDIFYNELENRIDDTNEKEARKQLLSLLGNEHKELIDRTIPNFLGDTIRNIFYEYQSKVQEEIKKEILD